MTREKSRRMAQHHRKLRVGFDPPAYCFKCGCRIRGAGRPVKVVIRKGKDVVVSLSPAERRREAWEAPSHAVLFRGGGSFGSREYDTLVDGMTVGLIVCDACLVKHRLWLRHTTEESEAKARCKLNRVVMKAPSPGTVPANAPD